MQPLPVTCELPFVSFPSDVIRLIGSYCEPRDYKKLCMLSKRLWNLFLTNIQQKLKRHQMEHYNNLVQALKMQRYVCDSSLMGSGKTYTAVATCLRLGLSLTVVCPKSVVPTWKQVSKVFGIPAFIINYTKLQMNNPLLVKGDKWKYIPTEFAKERIRQGTLLVFDEAQNMKNKSNRFDAGVMLAKEIYKVENKRSRVMLLSATAVDKMEQLENVCRLLGIIKSDTLARYDIQRGYILTGLSEFLDACPIKESEKKYYLKSINKTNKFQRLFDLFLIHIKPKCFFSMPNPEIEGTLDVKNGYYYISKEATVKMGELMGNLNTILYQIEKFQEGQIKWDPNNNPWTHLKNCYKKMEHIKAKDMCIEAKKLLVPNKKNKVVLVYFYTQSITDSAETLKDYNPLILNGKTKDREETIRLFNEDPKHRVLVCNLKVGSEGISLHDTIGDSPRFMLISPNWFVMHMHQVSYRIYRTGTIGTATVRYFYYREYVDETKILHRIAEKSIVMSKMKDEKVKADCPSEHENIYID